MDIIKTNRKRLPFALIKRFIFNQNPLFIIEIITKYFSNLIRSFFPLKYFNLLLLFKIKNLNTFLGLVPFFLFSKLF
jgi:hypothetical protein